MLLDAWAGIDRDAVALGRERRPADRGAARPRGRRTSSGSAASPMHHEGGAARGATVFCAPSLRRESFGVVLLEAMAAGTAVLASDIDGLRERAPAATRTPARAARRCRGARAGAAAPARRPTGCGATSSRRGSARAEEFSTDAGSRSATSRLYETRAIRRAGPDRGAIPDELAVEVADAGARRGSRRTSARRGAREGR